MRGNVTVQGGEFMMPDLLMLVFGVGMFACFLAYTVVCDKI
jgi:hypothetical protein